MCGETMLTSFCKSVHTLLGLSDNPEDSPVHRNTHHRRKQSIDGENSGGLSLIAAEVENPKNVLEASALKPPRKDVFPVSNPLEKPVPVTLDCYDNGFGLQSCTESLGFESSDVMMSKTLEEVDRGAENGRSRPQRRSRKNMVSKTEVKFPPPLSSMRENGRGSYYLKPARRDGKFILTEVKIERPEILHASRGDGRLRLRLVTPLESSPQEEERDEEQNRAQEQEQAQAQAREQEQEKDKETVPSEWQGTSFRFFPLKSEGSWRCYEQSHHHLTFWNARCVTTS